MKVHDAIGKSILNASAILALAFASVDAASSQELVSIKGESVNMRAAPSLSSEVLWQLGPGYPLKVVGRKGSWLNVVDFENDKGWVAGRLTDKTPHAIVKSRIANIRSGPGTTYRILGKAEYGEVFQVLERRKSWVRVQGDDKQKGWIARTLLWGW